MLYLWLLVTYVLVDLALLVLCTAVLGRAITKLEGLGIASFSFIVTLMIIALKVGI